MNKVCVLMSTYNGELYIKQQLDSIFAQNEVEVSVFARVDNSSDETTNILREYSEQQPLKFYSGNNLGPGLSFIDLIHHCEEYEYYAFADQDDVWESNKLVCAIDALKGYKEKVAFYNSNVAVVDEELTKKSEIYGTEKVYNFYTQIARSNIIGCTVVMNNNMMKVLKKYKPNYVCMHDQWIGIVCKAINGIEIKDMNTHMLYRQHNNNTVGTKKNIYDYLKGSFVFSHERSRYKQLCELRKGYYDDLDIEKKEIIDALYFYDKSVTSFLRCLTLNFNAERWYYNLIIRLSFIFKKF